MHYRQASQFLTFVTGSFFTGTDDGTIRFGLSDGPQGEGLELTTIRQSEDAVLIQLRAQFDNAVTCNSSLGPLWVAPDIGTVPESQVEKDGAVVTAATNLLAETSDIIIKAPPLFGLTALGHFLALHAWLQEPGRLYLVTPADDLPNHESGIKTVILRKLSGLGTSAGSPIGMIIDTSPPATNCISERSIVSSRPSPRYILFFFLRLTHTILWA